MSALFSTVPWPDATNSPNEMNPMVAFIYQTKFDDAPRICPYCRKNVEGRKGEKDNKVKFSGLARGLGMERRWSLRAG